MNYFTEDDAIGALIPAPPLPDDPASIAARFPQTASTSRAPQSFWDSLGRAPDPSKSPGALPQAAMSFSTNPEQQARIGKRMGADIAGVRTQFDGTPVGYTAGGTPFPLQAPFGFSTLPGFAARAAGPALPWAGGAAGGIAGGSTTLVAGPAMAAAGAAAGDLARQGVATALDPAASGFHPDLRQTLTEALLGGAGQLGGALLGRAIAPVNPGLSGPDISKLRAGPTMERARAAYAAAQDQGVPLTPGQATDLPSLLAREDVAARAPWGMDRAADFYAGQGDALAAAGGRQVAAISPTAARNKTTAALEFAEGASDAATQARRMANEAARPAYQVAENAGPVRFGDLAARPTMQAAIGRATAQHVDEFGRPAPAVPDFRVWDSVKKSLDDMVSEASRKGANNEARIAAGLREQLVTRLDDVYPTYAEARALAAPGQQTAAALTETAAGRTANAGIDERARAIVAPIFQQSNPQYIGMARDAFIRSGPDGERIWNGGLGAFIKDEMERASTSATGLNAAMLRRNLIGKEDTRAALEAAMTPQQFKGFTQFMDTVENVARTYPMNSLTQPRAAMARQMEAEATTGAAVRTGQVIESIGGPNVLRLLERQGTRLREWGTERNLRASLDYLFTPDGLPMLEALAKARPGTQNAINLTAQIMSRAVPSAPAGSAATPTPVQAGRRQSVEELLLQ